MTLKISYEAQKEPRETPLSLPVESRRVFLVHTNFNLPTSALTDDSSAASLLWRMSRLEGVEQIALSTRYCLVVQIGKHFNWEAVWPSVYELLVWYGQGCLANVPGVVDSRLKEIEQATNAPAEQKSSRARGFDFRAKSVRLDLEVDPASIKHFLKAGGTSTDDDDDDNAGRVLSSPI